MFLKLGRLWMLWHDRGVWLAWDQVIRWECRATK